MLSNSVFRLIQTQCVDGFGGEPVGENGHSMLISMGVMQNFNNFIVIQRQGSIMDMARV